jgi:hypothetical protein
MQELRWVQCWIKCDNFENKTEMRLVTALVTTSGRYSCKCSSMSSSLRGCYLWLNYDNEVIVIYLVQLNVTVITE